MNCYFCNKPVNVDGKWKDYGVMSGVYKDNKYDPNTYAYHVECFKKQLN